MSNQNHTMTTEEFAKLHPSVQLRIVRALSDHADDMLTERPVERLILLECMRDFECLPDQYRFLVNWLGADVPCGVALQVIAVRHMTGREQRSMATEGAK